MTLWTVARQAPLSMGFYRQEHWSGLPFPFPKIKLQATLTDLQRKHVKGQVTAALKESKERQSEENEGKSSVPGTGRRGERRLNFEENNLNANMSKRLQRSRGLGQGGNGEVHFSRKATEEISTTVTL